MVASQDRGRAKALIKEAIDHYSKYLKKLGISRTHLQLEIDQQLMKLREVNREINDSFDESSMGTILRAHDVLCPAIRHFKRTLQAERAGAERIGIDQVPRDTDMDMDIALLDKICPGT